jgi:hypothetical protein
MHGEAQMDRVASKADRESFDDFLTVKTFGAIRASSVGAALVGDAGSNGMGGFSSELLRNLCVRIDALRLVELDAVTDVLDCSKQEFVVEALSAALLKAFHRFEEHGLAAVLEQRYKQRFEQAGFSFCPIAGGDSHQTLHFNGEPVRLKNRQQRKRGDGSKDSTAGEKASAKSE